MQLGVPLAGPPSLGAGGRSGWESSMAMVLHRRGADSAQASLITGISWLVYIQVEQG